MGADHCEHYLAVNFAGGAAFCQCKILRIYSSHSAILVLKGRTGFPEALMLIKQTNYGHAGLESTAKGYYLQEKCRLLGVAARRFRYYVRTPNIMQEKLNDFF